LSIDASGDAELWALYVVPAEQGRGLGHALWVAAGNAPARRFYEQHGAVSIAERVDRIGDGVVAEVRYRVPLLSPGDRAKTDQRPIARSPRVGGGDLG
jgi:ribosomal protein S18 acetylase RimI-like enzyme